MDQEYQGLGPDERMALNQLFRETGKEERGAPEIEMHDRGGQVSRNPADHHGMKANHYSSAAGFADARKKKARQIYVTPL